ncbi:MAG: hypothetical protein U9O85_08495 [Euryarchaeota archaeon]|nr:hypothetical protein [Euryarchaeota archaeon]
MKSKKLVIGISVLAIVIVVLLVYKLAFAPVVVEGVVEWKGITGVKDNTHTTILINEPVDGEYRILVKDKDYESFFSDIGNAQVNKSLGDKLKADYLNIYYYVEITVNSSDPVNELEKGNTYGYYVSREDFNKVQIWDNVRYGVSRWSEQPRIKEFLKVHTLVWEHSVITIHRKDERLMKFIDDNPYRLVMGNRPGKNCAEAFVMIGEKPYKITIYLDNETVKSIEEVKDPEQVRKMQRIIELQSGINVTEDPHEICPYLVYRDFVEMGIGDSNGLLFTLHTATTELEAKHVNYTVGVLDEDALKPLPEGIEVIDNWTYSDPPHRKSPVTVLRIKASPTILPGQYELCVQLEADGIGVVGRVPLTINVKEESTNMNESADDIICTPAGPAYRAKVIGPGEKQWPPIEEKKVILGS